MAQFCLVHHHRDKFILGRSSLLPLSMIVAVVSVRTSTGPSAEGMKACRLFCMSGRVSF